MAPGQQGRGVRFHRYYLDIGILLLQIPASTGQSPTRPNSGYKNIHVSICVTPDLRPGGLVVGTGIGWIFKLAGIKLPGIEAASSGLFPPLPAFPGRQG